MTTRFFYRENTGAVIEVVHGVDLTGFNVQNCAELGRVGNGTITVRDPLGVYDFSGLRTCYLVEYDIPEVTDQTIWRGYVAGQGISRGKSELTAASRVWTLQVVDQNSILPRRIQVGADGKRPAETDVARMQWLADTAEAGIFIDTTTYLHTDRPTRMNEVDYQHQANQSVINDCSQQSGKNYWADFINTLGITLWYGYAGEPDWVASIAISNVLSEVDADSIFAPAKDAELSRDPSRIFSGVDVQYDGGAIYRTRPATATEFAVIDTSMSAINTKTAALASKRAGRYLIEGSTQEERITVTLILPSTHVNRAKGGQWINCHFSHLPGYQTFVPMRIASRTLSKLTPKWYKVVLELSGGDALPPPGNAAARLYFPLNRRGDDIDLNPEIVFDNTGDDPGVGRAYYPLLGDGLSYHEYSGFPGDVWDGIQVESDGTVDVNFRASLQAVVSTEVEAVFTIWLDGDVLATTTVAEFHAGPGSFGATASVEALDVEVTAGQLIHASIETTGTFLGGYKSPGGVGGPDECLSVAGTFS